MKVVETYKGRNIIRTASGHFGFVVFSVSRRLPAAPYRCIEHTKLAIDALEVQLELIASIMDIPSE